MLKRKTSSRDLKPGGVLAKCAKIALLARVLCIYPVVVGWSDLGSISELLLVIVAVAGSTGLLLSWDRLSGFVRRHPSVVAIDILVALMIFGSTSAPHVYMGYLGSTAVLIGLFFPTVGQIALTLLLSCGYLSVAMAYSFQESSLAPTPAAAAASLVLFACLTYVGRVMQRLQAQVDLSLQAAKKSAAEAAQGDERARVARELHDSLVKSLEGISLQAVAMKMRGEAPDSAAAISAAAKQAVQESRELLSDLREAAVPPLCSALERTVEELQALYPVCITLEVEKLPDLPVHLRHATHKIVEEALSNAAQHSGSGAVTCRISRVGGKLHAEVQDYGSGLPRHAQRQNGHFGLTGMRERAEEAGGRLTISSKEGRGTTVVFSVPLGLEGEMNGRSARSHS
ncbi:histidine kinase [Nesterenkonia massiliensis]|uniref:histidine kinase n=1 Tax=Nesterenkonia massiliensis TaxID=1232429 RepID=A0ABT2HRC3_9MICC|nr:ATP-binding protein [Nesterenkonia massiliensis]MCT1607245.1 histidine kinase [Nesterenkonia massiliensis]